MTPKTAEAAAALADGPKERAGTFTTISGRPINRLYTAADIAGLDYAKDLNDPGAFPYTRGIHPTGYRGKLWTMRQFAGFGTPEETNERYKTLLAAGGTGLSVAFDLPTLMGRDPDHPLSLGEVGKCGVNVTSLADMERLFDGITLADITTSMTINSPAPMIFAMYLVVAEKQGADWQKLSGTIQNDILKEFIAQKEYIFPPRPSMRLITDIFAFCSKEVPKWNTISVSGYHIREAGSTSLQELAFTLRDGIEYVQYGIDAGLEVDAFLPRFSFFFNLHIDLFEEIAKLRAARRLWASLTRERLGARDPRSWQLRTHVQTSGVSLTAQQPLLNVARVAIEALGAVLGGAQSLHTNSYDETLGLPTRESATLALRTQQIIAEETGVVNTVDPLGGSYYLESLTQQMLDGCFDYFDKIDNFGGMVATADAAFIADDFPEDDKVLIQTFGLGWKDGRPRAIAVYLVYLAGLSPRHQRHWHGFELADQANYELDHDYALMSWKGEWPDRVLAFEARCQGQRTRNDIATAMGRPQLFKEVFDVMALPDGLRPFLLPTREEMNRFVLHFDQILSDNINAKFFAGDVELFYLEPLEGQQLNRIKKGTIRLLKEWVEGRYGGELAAAVTVPLAEVRQLRQDPAHRITTNGMDPAVWDERARLLGDVHAALRALRLKLMEDPAAAAFELPSWIDFPVRTY